MEDKLFKRMHIGKKLLFLSNSRNSRTRKITDSHIEKTRYYSDLLEIYKRNMIETWLILNTPINKKENRIKIPYPF